MKRIEFEDAQIIEDAYVEIDGVKHYVIPAQTSGGTDLNKDTFNGMQDNIEEAIEEQFSTEETYSTEEKVIGTWIDGKTIYRKIVVINSLPNAETRNSVMEINADKCISIKGFAFNETDKTSLPLPYSSATDISSNIEVYYRKHPALANQYVLTTKTGTDRSTMTGYVILEYTKTTD